MEEYILNVYNTLTGQYEDIEVSEELYNEYKRSDWRDEKRDKKVNQTTVSLSFESDSEYIDLQDFVKNSELKAALDFAVLQLGETLRRRFLLKYYYGYKIAKIAEMEGISVSAVKQSLRLAKEELRETLKENNL